MDFQVGVVGIGLAGQQGFKLQLGGVSLQIGEGALGFLDDTNVAFFLTKFDQADVVFNAGFQLENGLDAGIELLALTHDVLSALLVVPQVGIFNRGVQLLKLLVGIVPVKDASSAARSTA